MIDFSTGFQKSPFCQYLGMEPNVLTKRNQRDYDGWENQGVFSGVLLCENEAVLFNIS